MLNWHDMAVFYANNNRCETLTIAQQKFITYADLGKQEPQHPAFHFVPGITDLVIPQFTLLERRHLLVTGAILKKIC